MSRDRYTGACEILSSSRKLLYRHIAESGFRRTSGNEFPSCHSATVTVSMGKRSFRLLRGIGCTSF
jgi:hypothetical protein